MTKELFLRELARRLHPLSDEEKAERLSYYEELLDDMIEDGISEEDAVAKLGDVHTIAEEILQEQPLPTLVKNRVRPKNGWNAAAITIAILGAPLWISLLLALIVTVAAVALSIVAVILSLILTAAALACAGVLMIVRGFSLLPASGSYAVFGIGAGFVTLGTTCLMILAAKYSTIGLCRSGQWLFRAAKKRLIAKED